jgi:antitoxin CcdA
MGYAKKPVNLSLSADLVSQARQLTPNLSETVERLLTEFVRSEQARLSDREARMEASLDFLIRHYEEHGGAGDEFSPF